MAGRIGPAPVPITPEANASGVMSLHEERGEKAVCEFLTIIERKGHFFRKKGAFRH